MERLAEEVYTNGFKYTLLERGKRACVYLQHAASPRYEVFIIRTRAEEKIKGKLYPEREVYPPTREWGFTAWTYIKPENALRHFEKIEKINDQQ